jgi:hypothetical protein
MTAVPLTYPLQCARIILSSTDGKFSADPGCSCRPSSGHRECTGWHIVVLLYLPSSGA